MYASQNVYKQEIEDEIKQCEMRAAKSRKAILMKKSWKLRGPPQRERSYLCCGLAVSLQYLNASEADQCLA